MKPAFIEKLIGRVDRLDRQSVTSVIAHLVEEKGFLETVFNALTEGVLVLNSENKAIYLNQAVRELFGLSDNFKQGTSFQRYLPDHFLKRIEENRQRIKSQPSIHQDIEISYPQHRILKIYASPLPSSQKATKADFLFIVQDVTETYRQVAKNVETGKTEALTTLAAGIAHEIGNPLNSLHIYMQLIERELKKLKGPSRKKLEEQIRVCLGEITRLDQIVNQFLKAVRPISPTFKNCSANEIIKEVIAVLGPEIKNRDILIQEELDSKLPSILADRNQIKQVLFNVLRNSLQAMTKGGILHLQTEYLTTERILISIRDTGGGIPPETLQRIFEPYFTTKNDGSGLGLMIVERIVREHGGLIEVSSEEKRGTTFRIFLPVAGKRIRLLSQKSSS